MKPDETRWNQMKPDETRWNQMKPAKSAQDMPCSDKFRHISTIDVKICQVCSMDLGLEVCWSHDQGSWHVHPTVFSHSLDTWAISSYYGYEIYESLRLFIKSRSFMAPVASISAPTSVDLPDPEGKAKSGVAGGYKWNRLSVPRLKSLPDFCAFHECSLFEESCVQVTLSSIWPSSSTYSSGIGRDRKVSVIMHHLMNLQ